LSIVIEIGNRSGEEIAYHNLGCCSYLLDDLMGAFNYFEQGIHICNSIRSRLGKSNSPKSFLLETQKKSYKMFEQVLLKMAMFESPLEVSEEGRTRSFVDQFYRRLSPSIINSPSVKWNEIKEFCANITVVEYSLNTEMYLQDGKVNYKAGVGGYECM
jgi:hypothetical protein